jgi:hypothetical protein
MTNSKTPEWERVRDLEDVMFVLGTIDQLRAEIKLAAWQQGGYQRVFQLAEEQRVELDKLRPSVKRLYDKWIKEARE